MKDKLRDCISSIRGAVRRAPGSGLAKELALHLLNEVAAQHDEIVNFWNDWHNELHFTCDHSPETSWTFIGTCGFAIGQALSTPRKQVAEHTQLDNPEQKADIIWAVMQTHLLVNRMIRNKFKSDNVVKDSLSNFLMKNRVDKSRVVSVETKFAPLVKSVAEVKQKAATTEANIKSLKTSLQAHTKQIEKLQKEKKDK